MIYQKIRAGINLFAILKNLEDLIAMDSECNQLVRDKEISIQFKVRNGPEGWVNFNKGKCEVGQGRMKNPKIVLWFTSPEHLNKMFDGKANPVPLKGLSRINFLKNEFTQITSKLEYYLKPEINKNPTEEYIQLNTRFTLTVAAFALSEIGKYDRKAKITASHIPNGKIQLSVLPDGPAVYLTINNGIIVAKKGQTNTPDAVMEMKDYKTANDFLNGRSNPFKAIASGEVMIKGQTPMLDNISLILDKVQHYIA